MKSEIASRPFTLHSSPFTLLSPADFADFSFLYARNVLRGMPGMESLTWESVWTFNVCRSRSVQGVALFALGAVEPISFLP